MLGLSSPELDSQFVAKEFLLGKASVGVFALNPDGSPRSSKQDIEVSFPEDKGQASVYGCSLGLVEGHGRRKEYMLSAARNRLIDGYYYGEGCVEQEEPNLTMAVMRAFKSASNKLRDLPGKENSTASGAVLAVLPGLEKDSRDNRAIFGWVGKVAVITLNSLGEFEFRSQPHVEDEKGKRLSKSLVQLGDGPEMKKTGTKKGRTVILCTSRVAQHLSNEDIKELRKKSKSPGELAEKMVKRVFEKKAYQSHPRERKVLAAAVVQF